MRIARSPAGFEEQNRFACLGAEQGTTIPTHSPWGRVDHHEVIAPGIVSVSTASHGGVHLDEWRQAQIPQTLGGPRQWYEEDCAWAIPAVAFPHEFPERVRESAVLTLRNWLPDEYEAHFREVIPPGQSCNKDTREFNRKHANDFVVTSAFGASQANERWGLDLSEDKVLVFARQGVGFSRSPGGEPALEKIYLVDSERYRKHGHSHVIDSTVDTELPQELAARCR